MSYFVRLSYSAKQLDGWLKLTADRCSSVVAYEHSDNEKNIHIHALLKDCSVSTDTLKNYVRKFIGSVPKTNWSFKEAISDDCITYMSKGKLEPIFVKNYEESKITEYKLKWEVRESKIVKKKNENIISQYAMAMEIYDKLKEKYDRDDVLKEMMENGGYRANEYLPADVYRECVKIAIHLHNKYQKGYDEFSIRKVVIPAFNKFRKCQESFIEKVVQNYFR